MTAKKEKLGIGLWWSRVFMQATGGDVLLKQTELGKSTTFLVRIPSFGPYGNNASQTQVLKQMDIFVVDDEPDWLQTFVDGLAPDSYRIATATGYAEASSLLATTHFTVAALDVRLVEADANNVGGLDLLAKISQGGFDTRVIMITAHGTEQHQETARRSPNVIAFLRKQEIDMQSIRDILRPIIRPTASTKEF